MASKTVYRCKQGLVVVVKGARKHYAAGALVFEDDPVKPKNNPNFEEIGAYVERISQPRWRGAVVEQATADPGERRRLGGLLPPKRDSAPPADSETSTGDGKPPAELERPPVSGAGSGADAWREYAAKVTDSPVESWAALSRADIIETLDKEGVDDDEA